MAALSIEILRNRNFCLLLMTRLFTMTALQAQAVIVGWQVYTITKSTFMLGLVGLAEAVPAIICALFAGYFVDTRHPRNVYVWCCVSLVLTTALLFIFAGGYFEFSDNVTLIALYIGVALSGLGRAFIMPSSFALISMLVPRAQYSAAAAWRSTMMQVATIGGPTIGGIVYGFYGVQVAWILPLAMMLVALAAVFFIRVKDERVQVTEHNSAIDSIKEGWAFLIKNNSLLSIMSLDMLAVLFGGAIALLPAFADQILGVGPEGLGLLRAAPAAGAILTGLYFALKPMQKITALRLFIVVAGFGVSMIGFGLSNVFWVSLLFLALSGAFDSVSMVIRHTFMQLLTPDHMRGRVSSVNSMFIISSNELGAFQSGVAATLLGLVPSVVFGGIATLGVVGITALVSPKFRKLDVRA